MLWDFRKNLLNLDKIKSKEIPIKNCKHFVYYHTKNKSIFIKNKTYPKSDFSE